MVLWQIFAIVGIASLILEMVVPSMFFLNLAIAGFITAIISVFWGTGVSLTIVYTIIAILSIIFIRPLLVRTKSNPEDLTGLEGKYIGKIAKVITPITKSSGAISIYDERWEARTESDEEIPAGTEVTLIKNESLVFTVERV